jgi:perosamine synthetase
VTLATDPGVSVRLVEALSDLWTDRAAASALHEPFFGGNETAYVRECIDTGWVSSVGKFVDRFEHELAAFTGAQRAVAVANGTAALHVALVLAGVKPGDEVIIPTLTFVGTANAVCHAGAIPHFVDSDPVTLGLDPNKLAIYFDSVADIDNGVVRNRRTGRRIAAVVPVHIYGHPMDIGSLVVLCAKLSIPIVEDAAESLGSLFRERHTGTFGLLSAMSFNGNKTVTTGGGGAILTNDEAIGTLAKHLTTTAKKPHSWRFDHDMVAWNYRMPNINAALGCAQLEQLPQFLADKRRLAARYRDALSTIPGVRFVSEPPGSRSNYWLSVILIDEGIDSDLESILAALQHAGIGARPAWTLMHRLPMYVDAPRGDLSVAEQLASRIINLPSGVKVARSLR